MLPACLEISVLQRRGAGQAPTLKEPALPVVLREPELVGVLGARHREGECAQG